MFDYFTCFINIGLSMFILIKFFPIILNESFGYVLLLLSVPVVLIIQALRGFKVFFLYEDKIVVKRPLFRLFDNTYKLSDVMEVEFNSIKGRFGGNVINIRTKYTSNKQDESFRFNFKNNVTIDFIYYLREVGFVVKDEKFQN